MSFSDEPIIPTEPTPPPRRDANAAAAARSRRRRANRREMFPADAEGQAAFISDLSRRAYPSFELFVFSLACGAILGLGFLLDSQAVLLLGILVTPLMIPWVGFLLAILTGSPRFLFETLMALLISGVLFFLAACWQVLPHALFCRSRLPMFMIHARLWMPELIVLAVGAITLVASFARSENKPFLPSVLIAYAFYLPINAGGFGLGSGLAGIWPQGIFVFADSFCIGKCSWSANPLRLKTSPHAARNLFQCDRTPALRWDFGHFYGIRLAVEECKCSGHCLIHTRNSAHSASIPNPRPDSNNYKQSPPFEYFNRLVIITPTSGTITGTATAATATVSPSPVPLTLSITLPATETPTVTLTFEPQTISGKVGASEGGGANLRQTPNGKYLMTLDNGTIVEIYPDFRQVNGVAWMHVVVTRNGQRVEGWLLESVVSYATPEPNFEPSATPTVGVTPAP